MPSKNIYEDPSRPKKPSAQWAIPEHPSAVEIPTTPPPITPPAMPAKPETHVPDLSSMSGTGTINAHARTLMARSKKFGQ